MTDVAVFPLIHQERMPGRERLSASCVAALEVASFAQATVVELVSVGQRHDHVVNRSVVVCKDSQDRTCQRVHPPECIHVSNNAIHTLNSADTRRPGFPLQLHLAARALWPVIFSILPHGVPKNELLPTKVYECFVAVSIICKLKTWVSCSEWGRKHHVVVWQLQISG